MLVLSRKAGEEIVIDDQITIRVIRLGGGRVRLGISAPPHIPVSRSELSHRLRQSFHGEMVDPRPGVPA
ncbi:MAG: carbon storage regulator [Planctomycetaceae bacterium]|nr:carbon storage regulator [Planctomycetaceae bacterium]